MLADHPSQEKSNWSLPSLDVEIRFRSSLAGVRLQLPLIVLQNVLIKQHTDPSSLVHYRPCLTPRNNRQNTKRTRDVIMQVYVQDLIS